MSSGKALHRHPRRAGVLNSGGLLVDRFEVFAPAQALDETGLIRGMALRSVPAQRDRRPEGARGGDLGVTAIADYDTALAASTQALAEMTTPFGTGSLMPLLSELYLWRVLRWCGKCDTKPGADGMTWAQLRRDAKWLLPRLARQLAEGSWQPGLVRPTRVQANSVTRTRIAVLPVMDQLVHVALRNAIEPILDELAFKDWVSGFRPRRNRITALRRAATYHDAGHRWVADVRVFAAAAGVTTEEAIGWLAEYIHDDTFLELLRTALAAMPSPIMPGSSLANSLINLRLSEIDKRLPSLRLVRFADNYVAFASSHWQSQEVFYTISDALLSQRLHPDETRSRIRSDVNIEDLFLIGE
jgi:RNA-directed DNA polymerase